MNGDPAPVLAPAAGASRLRSWAQRFGVIGFLFFFVKGLLWLTVPLVLVLCRRWMDSQ